MPHIRPLARYDDRACAIIVAQTITGEVMALRSKLLGVARDAWRAERAGSAAILARQHARLAGLIRFARAQSPLYHKRYGHLPPDVTDLRQLPPVTKPQLMARFDEWVTDPAVTRGGVEAFVADKTLVGRPYLGQYFVCTTSGVTGVPGIFVHDDDAMAVYRALTLARGLVPWMTPRRLWATLRQGDRVAAVVNSGGHFASSGMMEVARGRRPRPFNRVRTFSAAGPVPELVRELNALRPAQLVGYPSALMLLAQEQAAGRLAIRPALVGSGGEWLSPSARGVIEAAFRCRVRENYGAAEFADMAWGCLRGGLHVSADWAILEPVDDRHRPVPPGQPSHTVLLTNLANRVQPLIRYDLGDSITAISAPCPCGSPLPRILVEGRRDEILVMETPGGRAVPLLPMVLKGAAYRPGVRRGQVIQTGPATLSVRLDLVPGADGRQIWEAVTGHLRGYLSAQGLPLVGIERSSEPPTPDPASGKFRAVWAAWKGGPARTDVPAPPERPVSRGTAPAPT